MIKYKENPKTKDSGIICCIPQKGLCPNRCEDCFFQSGRSYLEPLSDNLRNMPTIRQAKNKIVRVNDGNDSSYKIDEVLKATKKYKQKFFNTANPSMLNKFKEPVVLTINPGNMTDKKFYRLVDIPINLMFVRIRVNTWNIEKIVDKAIDYYTIKKIPIVLTFMAYYTSMLNIPENHKSKNYSFRKRTLNSYYVITNQVEHKIYNRYKNNVYVYTCGYKGNFSCHRCGNCLREYYATKERIKNGE